VAKFLLLLSLISACAHKPVMKNSPEVSEANQRTRDLLLGHWYGEGLTEEKKPFKWLIFRKTSGEFEMSYEVATQLQTYSGFWGVWDQTYFTTVDHLQRHTYKIISLTENEFKFHDQEHATVLIQERVSAEFKISRD
jgi:hypothetical protein